MFRILVVDDEPFTAHLLQALMENLHRLHEVHSAKDGVEALDFLHCRGAYVDAPRPNLILLDMNMPRLSGLETLSAIKSDSQLCVIPIIMLSTADSPEGVRKSYQAHANCYVQKPTNLERFVKLIQAVEAFWMDFAVLPSSDMRTAENLQSTHSKREMPTSQVLQSGEGRSGPMIAPASGEAGSRAMRSDDSPAKVTAAPSRSLGCDEHNRLLDEFGAAVQELLKIHQQQFLAIFEGDVECPRFDILIHMANEKKQWAKYAYMRHVESHGCSNMNALKQTRP